MAAKELGFIVLVLVLLMPALGNAAYAEMEHFRTKISGATDFAVVLIITDFWDKPLFYAMMPVQNGEAVFPAGSTQCKSTCKAKVIDVTREEYEAIRQNLQRGQSNLENICKLLRSGC